MKKEAIYLVTNTFSKIPVEYKLRMIIDATGPKEENSNLMRALVTALIDNLSLDHTMSVLNMLCEIFDTAEQCQSSSNDNSLQLNYKGNLLNDILDEFSYAGGPETIEGFLNDKHNGISKIAGDISIRFLSEQMDQVYDISEAMNQDNIEF